MAHLRRTRTTVAAIGLVAAAALGLTACGDDGDSGATSTPVGTASAANTVEVSYKGGTITGGGKRTVALGQPVTITVSADLSDEVHVHGYDETGDVTASAPASITFKADKPGIFEVELEKKGLKLFELEVK